MMKLKLNSDRDSDHYGTSLHIVCGEILDVESIDKFRQVNSIHQVVEVVFVRIFMCKPRKVHACQCRMIH